MIHKKLAQQPADIVVCGMSRSGSTLVMNLVCQLLRRESNYCYFYDYPTYKATFGQSSDVKKTHHYTYFLERRILAGHTTAIFTYRNIYDVVASTIQRGWKSSVVEMIDSGYIDGMLTTAILYMRLDPVVSVKYEDLYSKPRDTVVTLHRRIACDEISPDTIESCLALCRRPGQIRGGSAGCIAKVPDQRTGYHASHVLDPEPGKYKSVLSQDDTELLGRQRLVRQYMEMCGYSSK